MTVTQFVATDRGAGRTARARTTGRLGAALGRMTGALGLSVAALMGAALVSGGLDGAAAQQQNGGYQMRAEWADKFDSTLPQLAAVKSTTPTLSPETATAIEQAIVVYQGIVAQGGWQPVPTGGAKLRIGMRDAKVVALRRRLMVTGDMQQTAGFSDIFDSYVDSGVRRFQLRHGLQADGVLNAQTIAAMNVPAEQRLAQLQLNLVRVRSMSGFLGERFVMVNIPAAEIETVESGAVHSRHTAVVGKVDRQTPILNSKISVINFNPYWHVPVSIIRKDLIPKMQKDPTYLERNKIRIYDQAGNELQANQIDWNTQQAMQYLFRQDPGDLNSMGSVKINFNNPYSVYMHDTPSKTLFGTDGRFHSSGCVRVQNVREVIVWLLKNTPGWDREHVDAVIRSGERIDAPVKDQVPLYFAYITAWANSDGVVHFVEDIYGRDGGAPTDQVAMQ